MGFLRSPLRDRRRVVIALAATVAAALAVAAFVLLDRGTRNDKPLAQGSPTAAAAEIPGAAEPASAPSAPAERATTDPRRPDTGGGVFTAEPKAVASAKPVPVPPNYDGCDHNYGAVTQCVPWTFPDGITAVTDKCEWLKLNGFRELAVTGKDRQGLDGDGDRIVCNS